MFKHFFFSYQFSSSVLNLFWFIYFPKSSNRQLVGRNVGCRCLLMILIRHELTIIYLQVQSVMDGRLPPFSFFVYNFNNNENDDNNSFGNRFKSFSSLWNTKLSHLCFEFSFEIRIKTGLESLGRWAATWRIPIYARVASYSHAIAFRR